MAHVNPRNIRKYSIIYIIIKIFIIIIFYAHFWEKLQLNQNIFNLQIEMVSITLPL